MYSYHRPLHRHNIRYILVRKSKNFVLNAQDCLILTIWDWLQKHGEKYAKTQKGEEKNEKAKFTDEMEEEDDDGDHSDHSSHSHD
jgi:hypothetical protein